ncbi:MAG: hypothetical protein OS130_02410 [Thermodesulfobacteriota bacterium]|jgi:hypothetical protein|nr:MAG: hypothetical protein OS130_02410 [Thermodesulfobacteriota bacterium]
MDITVKHLEEACFDLARSTKGEMRPVDISEITDLSKKFLAVALQEEEIGRELGVTIPLLTRAVHYLREAHAIPPMGGDIVWFKNMLTAVLEIACPNAGLDGQGKAFLRDLLKGIGSFLDDNET